MNNGEINKNSIKLLKMWIEMPTKKRIVVCFKMFIRTYNLFLKYVANYYTGWWGFSIFL